MGSYSPDFKGKSGDTIRSAGGMKNISANPDFRAAHAIGGSQQWAIVGPLAFDHHTSHQTPRRPIGTFMSAVLAEAQSAYIHSNLFQVVINFIYLEA